MVVVIHGPGCLVLVLLERSYGDVYRYGDTIEAVTAALANGLFRRGDRSLEYVQDGCQRLAEVFVVNGVIVFDQPFGVRQCELISDRVEAGRV